MFVDSVDLEHVLRQVDAYSRKLLGGRPISVQVVDKRLHFGTSMPLWVGAFIPLLTINEIWSMDFVTNALFDGRKLRMFTVTDLFTRECLAIDVDQS